MNKPHKHAEVIKAWADGHEVEWRYSGPCRWRTFQGESTPAFWNLDLEWRIKPHKKWYRVAKMNGAARILNSYIAGGEGCFEAEEHFEEWLTERIEYD